MKSEKREELLMQLDHDGVVILPDLVDANMLLAMQKVFAARLSTMRWSDVDGYEQTEPYRHMVQDLLSLDAAFVKLALHDNVLSLADDYLGEEYQLVEAKGWKSLATKRSFHGWHGDAWYDQAKADGIPRELKLAVYLTDVTSGEFQYVAGSHRKQHPRMVHDEELSAQENESIIKVTGPAGSAFIFDTSGIHRQAEPILSNRVALFMTYHDPKVDLQQEDLDYNRYHPLKLNAAFLSELTPLRQRVLGFGVTLNHLSESVRQPQFPRILHLQQRAHLLALHARELAGRVRQRFNLLLNRRTSQ